MGVEDFLVIFCIYCCQAIDDICRLAAAYPDEVTFKFTETEITYFNRLYKTLLPVESTARKPNMKTSKKQVYMEAAYRYMQ